MATQTTGGGSTTSFTNTPQAKDDSYLYLEDLLRDDATLYDSSTDTILLDVMSNDLGGSAKTLFSVENGDGDLIDDDFELLNKDVDASGCSPWEPTLNGNWVRINNGKIEYRIADGSGIPGQGRSVDSLTAGEVFADEFVYAIRLGNGTLSEAVVKISITGTNDNATISGDNDGALSENGVPGTVSGLLVVTDADAGQDELQPIPAGTAGDNGYGTFEVLADGNWTYTLNNGDPAVEALAAGEVVYDTITVTSEDGTDTEVITITITGTNDDPTVSDVSLLTPVEDGAAVTGSFSGDDVDSDDDGASLTYAITSDPSEGSVVNNGDGTFSFDPEDDFQDLAEGEERQVSFTYTATDSHGAVSNTGTVTVTVTGTNDDPLFSIVGSDSAEETIAETDSGLTASGTLTVTDADTSNVVDTVVTGVTLGGDYGSLTEGDVIGMLALTGDADLAADTGDSNNLGWDFDSGSEAFDFLAAGQSLTLTYQLTTTDDEGATDTQTVTITITGTNDLPFVSGELLAEVTEAGSSNGGGVPSVSGTATADDVDNPDNVFQPASGASDLGYGTYSIDADGNWQYVLDNDNADVDALNDGQTLEDHFQIFSDDGTQTQVTITINGANDFTYVSPAPFTGTGDPNDNDALGNPAGQNTSNQATNGDDTLYGGAGDDTINGGNGNDTIYGGSGGDGLGGGGDLDKLFGGSGSDTITGGNADDILIGGYGADILSGSNGADTFFYLSQKDTGDTINGFSQAEGDKIKFDTSFGFDSSDFMGAISAAGAVDAGKFGYMYDAGTNTTTIYVDTDGVFGADMEIKLTGNIVLVGSDFQFGVI